MLIGKARQEAAAFPDLEVMFEIVDDAIPAPGQLGQSGSAIEGELPWERNPGRHLNSECQPRNRWNHMKTR
jgi:hypothetical protein